MGAENPSARHPVGGGIGGDASDPDEARVVVDQEEYIEPPEQHGFDAEEVAGDQALHLSGEELGPAWPDRREGSMP